MKHVVETKRLRLRELAISDAPFIVELLNSPGWVRFIGDRNVQGEEQARSYLTNGPLKSYRENGFGLYMVEMKMPHVSIGMCGLLKRDSLDCPDIGFAFLPQYTGCGYAYEAATAMLEYAFQTLKLSKIAAITQPDNDRSIRLIRNIGMQQTAASVLGNDDKELLVFMSP